jgi:hypothetical protein
MQGQTGSTPPVQVRQILKVPPGQDHNLKYQGLVHQTLTVFIEVGKWKFLQGKLLLII